jgi:ubiquinone/menaquinone biosynthesis C-methylase UbiE
MNVFERMYARQEYLTPGAPETVAMVAAATAPGALVLEVASGKGEAACALAADGRRVVALDPYDGFLRYTRAKAVERGLTAAAGLVRGDGRALPFRDGAFDAACCIGAPSIVGLRDCIRELARVTRGGGAVIVSDITWRVKPDAALGPEWGWVAEFGQTTRDEYARILRGAALVLDEVLTFGSDAWDAYHAPMLAVAAGEREGGDAALAVQIEDGVALEQRAAAAFLDYTAFRCTKR